LGTNEVARAFGGQYWAEEQPDHRDHTRPSDVSLTIVSSILQDFLARQQKKGWLSLDKAAASLDELEELVKAELFEPCAEKQTDPPSLRERAAFLGLIEFMRAVHAEMAAITSAARSGIAVDGCTIYSTTFPCHECARHIVSAGLRRVVFVEPYPKSRVIEMFSDSIAVDEEDNSRVPFVPYVGVAPRLYRELFEMAPRRNNDGTLVDWEAIKKTQVPRIRRADLGYLASETEQMAIFAKLLEAKLPTGAIESGDTSGE
jgi:cytidine deaminase